MPMSPKLELSRIRYVERKWREHGLPYLEAEELIKQCLDKHERVCVSWSGGKCSTAVLHMTLQQKPDVQVFFNNTGVAFPETYAYIKKIRKEWKLKLRINKPYTTFWRLVKKHGFPQMRALGLDKKDRPSVPECCKQLKEAPIRRAYKIFQIQGDLDGLRVAESRVRTFALAQYGQCYYTKGYKVWRYHPIALWNTARLNQYYREHNIPMNELYLKGHDRSGCWCCTAFKDWSKALSKTHPRLYKFLAKKMGKTLLDDFPADTRTPEEIYEESVLNRECETRIKKGQLDLIDWL